MNPFLLILVLFLISSCATRSGKLDDDREYLEYDVLFDQEGGRFYVPLKWIEEQEYEYSHSDIAENNEIEADDNE